MPSDSTGRRSRPSPGRSSSTWAWAPPQIAAALIGAGARRGARGRGRVGHAAGAAHRARHARTIAQRVADEQVRPRRSPSSAGRRAARRAAWFAARPLAGATSSSPGRGRRPAASRGACASWVRRSWSPGDPDRAARRARRWTGAYDLICVTCPNGARALFERLPRAAATRARSRARDRRDRSGTARVLHAHGIAAHVVPERVGRRGWSGRSPRAGARALIARARGGRDVLPRRCASAVCRSTCSSCTSRSPTARRRARRRGRAADYVTFTSSSTVRNLLGAIGELSPNTRVVSIGPITSETLREPAS